MNQDSHEIETKPKPRNQPTINLKSTHIIDRKSNRKGRRIEKATEKEGERKERASPLRVVGIVAVAHEFQEEEKDLAGGLRRRAEGKIGS